MTICPYYNDAYKSDTLAKYNLTINDLRKYSIFPNVVEFNKTLANFFEEVTHDFEDIVERVVFHSNYRKDGTNHTSHVFSNKEEEKSNNFKMGSS